MYSANLDTIDIDECLSEDERTRAARFRSSNTRHRYVKGRSLLRHLLANYQNSRPRSICFHYGAYGKPMLKTASAERILRFNVSHCEEHFIAAFANTGDIGVDIEKVRRLPDEAKLVERFFHPEEAQEYGSLPNKLKTRGFFNGWTRKEAVLKAVGGGLLVPLDSFVVRLDPREPCRFIRNSSLPHSNKDWSLIDMPIGEDRVLALAYSENVSDLRLFDYQ